MFTLSTSVRSTHQVLAILVASALVLWSVGAYTTAQAANLVEVSNTLSDSAPGAQPQHIIEFTVPDGSSIDGSVTVEFPSGFTGVGDLDQTNVTVSGLNGFNDPTGSGQTLTITGGSAAENTVITITVAAGVVTNPAAAGSYEFEIVTNTGSGTDNGKTRVVILDTVLVSAEVETVFEFTVDGVGASETINGDTTTGATTATEIPFGVLDPQGVPTVLAQDLSVTTNAGNGFVVTVESDSDGDLVSSTGARINGFVDATYVDTPTPWVSPSNDVEDDLTWGHWGLTTNDETLDSLLGGGDFTANNGYVSASSTPRNVFTHDAAADGTTQNIGAVRVGYKIEIGPLQEAAQDYTTTLTYIATPTF